MAHVPIQCGNFRILLSLIFYVKSISEAAMGGLLKGRGKVLKTLIYHYPDHTYLLKKSSLTSKWSFHGLVYKKN